MKIHYDAPLTLNFSLVCVLVFVINSLLPGFTASWFTLYPQFQFTTWHSYFQLISYAFGHASIGHLLGNLSFILLLGPVLEERFGTKRLAAITGITILFTSVIFLLLFKQAILGASGVVFMMIILTSYRNLKDGKIPLTFILVVLLFLGKEILAGFEEDQISQSAHLVGGLCGGVIGYVMQKSS